MDSNLDIKDFECPYHSGEHIKRVLKQPMAKKLLYCLNCILESDTSLNNTLVTLESAIKDVHGKIASKPSATINSKPPDSLTSFLNDEDNYIAIFTEHILQQKEILYQKTKALEDHLISILHKARDKAALDLDTQLTLCKKNFQNYRNLINKTFSQDSKPQEPVTLDQIVSNVNNCRTALDLEAKLRSYLSEAESEGVDSGSQINMIVGLKNIKEKIEFSFVKLPTSGYGDETYYNENTDALKNQFTPLVNALSKIKDPVLPLGNLVASSLLTQSRLQSLKDLLKNPSLNLRIIEKAARDRSNIQEVLDSIMMKENIVVLLKTSQNKILGSQRLNIEEVKDSKLTQKVVHYSFNLNSGKSAMSSYSLKHNKDFVYISPNLLICQDRPDHVAHFTRTIKQLNIPVKPDQHLCMVYNYVDQQASLSMEKYYWEGVLTEVDELEIFEIL